MRINGSSPTSHFKQKPRLTLIALVDIQQTRRTERTHFSVRYASTYEWKRVTTTRPRFEKWTNQTKIDT